MENGMERVDIAIIGTGPAGVSAAITAKVRNKSVLLIGSRELSEKMSKAHQILNYPGPEVSGADLVAGYKKQLAGLGIEVTEKRVNAVYAMGDYFGIQASGEILEASTVILAAGIVMGKPFPGENELLGSGVSYCATCDAQFFRGKEVAVIGYGREAEQEADYLAEIVGKVHYFPMGKEEPQLSDAVEVVHERPKAITGGTQTVSALETDAGSTSGGRRIYFKIRDRTVTACAGTCDGGESRKGQSPDGDKPSGTAMRDITGSRISISKAADREMWRRCLR